MVVNCDQYGRILRDTDDLDLAMQAATTISKAVNISGIKPLATITKIDGAIFVGFVVRGNLVELDR